jgi:hypothetical protein
MLQSDYYLALKYKLVMRLFYLNNVALRLCDCTGLNSRPNTPEIRLITCESIM